MVKQQLVDKLPKRIRSIKFGIQSNQDITNQAVVEISDRLLYDIENNRAPYHHGPLDSRLDCGRVLLEEPERQQFLKELRRPMDNLRRTQICKNINQQCRKVKICPYCASVNGQIRKVGVLKLLHDKFVSYNKSTSAKKVPPESKIKFHNSFNEARQENPDLDKHLHKAMEDLNPLRVLNLFKTISPSDCELLGLDPTEGRPEMFIWQFLPAPPVCVRPSVAQDSASNEDDITTKLADIVWTIMEQWEYLQTQIAMNGPSVWPGAQQVLKKEDGGYKISLKFGNRDLVAKSLTIGDVVERHIEDGDIVLFNRQPSLHKLSIMSHLAKVRPWKTFRLNECVCNPYNADFDGDEMNLHVPQTEEARAEAINLMGVKHNLLTPRNGEPIIAATQDFITAAFLLSSKDTFFDRKTFAYMCMHMLDSQTAIDLPPPTIIAPVALWTGKQLFNVLIRPNKQSPVRINLDVKCKSFKARLGQCPDMDPNDGWLVVWNSELTNRGFSIGVGDVFPTESLRAEKENLVSIAYRQSDKLIELFKKGELEKAPGCNMEQTLENSISGILSKVRQQAGEYCIDTLSRNNAPLIMAKSGSKGSDINVAQMVALVGQQIIGGQRVPDGFQDRSLPHFHKNARQPPSKGFVKNSFYSGLEPTEFLFHAISGREGLVDTAVKTAETGYMSRRLMKSLEDLSTQYDDTVRTSSGSVVQFQYGADRLDPVDMEGPTGPVQFYRTWTHAENITWDNNEPSLSPDEIRRLCASMLEGERKRFPRLGLLNNEELDYEDGSDYAIDEHESGRRFLQAIESHVEGLASKLSRVRKLAGMGDGETVLGSGAQDHAERTAKVTASALILFIRLSLEKYKKAHVEPGHAVGAVGAQSIGEPGTQMTLKTFHFAGVAGMSITQGVPRIKEIINASKAISTPVITCPLLNTQQIEAAKVVKARIEKTLLSDVLRSIEDEWRVNEGNVVLWIDTDALADMHLGIDVYDIAQAICRERKLKMQPGDITISTGRIAIRLRPIGGTPGRGKSAASDGGDLLVRANFLRRTLPSVPISGYPHAMRALIETSDDNSHRVLVEGYGLRDCMATEGVVGTQVRTNSVMECGEVLGIEAARTTIADEINAVMGYMGIDPRHMQLLSDVMTFKGEVLGITRFGLSKMRDSVLHLASFEKTPDHLFEAAAGMKVDQIEGVSEGIIMGQTMCVGTGAFQVVRRLGIQPGDLRQKPTLFEDAWNAEMKKKGSKRAQL
ncbi:DNA-directed RNA polymerase III subunit RPC1 [Fusarium albosuccineum]|uniref:DNA-directed RNA polymerase subunit n=1 Tax=Fusarium albosuccineum TaxID=1237068 RepID=A0A8H4PI19_9HYPO|nr:DNA-directed RNA polymerase III subunit RPC1 [Fusarium albosuccineum]